MIVTDFYKEKRPELWPELDYNIQQGKICFDLDAPLAKLGKGKSRYQIHEHKKKRRFKHEKRK